MNWEQLKTVFWLRWRLMRNQSSRGGGLGAVIAALVGVGAILLGGACFAGALLIAALALADESPAVIMGIWFGVTVAFLFFWMIGLLTELQRSETIDLQRLMHLPVALGQVFLINYVASHFALSIIVAVPAMLGLSIGLAIARGPMMILLLPLALGMVFMITAWTYCLRGWLAAMMTNPRRRRTIIMGITLAFVLLGQGPNLYFNVLNRQDRHPGTSPVSPEEQQRRKAAQSARAEEMFKQLKAARRFIPPLWVPLGAQTLAEGRVLPALFGTLGCLAIGALGLRRAYRGTVRYYHGETGGKAAARIQPAHTPAATTSSPKTGGRFLELRFPAVPEQAVALALATFRSMLRAPEVKMAWASSFIVTLILGASVLFRSTPNIPEAGKPFVATGVVVFSIFILVQFFANQFGFDRDGFRVLILSPADRRLILLGKNLACLPVGAGFGVTLLTLVSVRLGLPLPDFGAALFQLATLLLLAGLAGNVLSILVPYRIQSGSLKPTKMPGLAMLVMFFSHMLFPVAMTPVFVPPLAGLLWRLGGWPRVVPVNLLLSAALAALTAFAYWQTLGPFGRLLQRRETKILGVVTVEVE
jgi:ABC-2 type transport system permease protein